MPKSQSYMRRVFERFLAIPSPENRARMALSMDSYADDWVEARVTVSEMEKLDANMKALADKSDA